MGLINLKVYMNKNGMCHSRLAQVAMFLPCIWEVPGLNVGWDEDDCELSFFYGFILSFHADADILPSSRP